MNGDKSYRDPVKERETVNRAIDEILLTLNPGGYGSQYTGTGVSINRNSRGQVRVSYRVTHFLTRD